MVKAASLLVPNGHRPYPGLPLKGKPGPDPWTKGVDESLRDAPQCVRETLRVVLLNSRPPAWSTGVNVSAAAWIQPPDP